MALDVFQPVKPLAQGAAAKLSDVLFAVWLSLWSAANVLTLTRFPFVHSDEPWLAGLSLAYLRETPFLATEPFFDLFPRQPHALKSLFHLIQTVFIKLFGFQIFSVRLASLIAGIIILALLYRKLRRELDGSPFALAVTIAFSLHIQFVYAAHMARQEIMILLVMVLAFCLYEQYPRKHFWPVPLLIGLAATLHPNAVIAAVMIGLVLLKDTLMRRSPVRLLWQYFLILAAVAAGLVLVSIAMNPDFIGDYLRYGATLSVDAAPASRFSGFIVFFQKIFGQVSGTYWLFDLRFWFFAAAAACAAAIFLLAFRHKSLAEKNRRGLENGLCGIAGFLAAIFLIGRNNPTSILFVIFPLFSLLAHLLQALFNFHRQYLRAIAAIAGAAVIAACLIPSLKMIGPFVRGTGSGADPYAAYLTEIAGHLPENAVVLGNLSAGFALSDVPFYDIRNLAYQGPAAGQDPGAGPDAATYCALRQINTVIWYEEYDYILRNPQWEILYGDNRALASLKSLVEKHGTPCHEFESTVYGVRIARYMGDYPWKIIIYLIDPAAIS